MICAPPPRRPQNGTQAHAMSRDLEFEDRLIAALPRFGTADQRLRRLEIQTPSGTENERE